MKVSKKYEPYIRFQTGYTKKNEPVQATLEVEIDSKGNRQYFWVYSDWEELINETDAGYNELKELADKCYYQFNKELEIRRYLNNLEINLLLSFVNGSANPKSDRYHYILIYEVTDDDDDCIGGINFDINFKLTSINCLGLDLKGRQEYTNMLLSKIDDYTNKGNKEWFEKLPKEIQKQFTNKFTNNEQEKL